MSPPSQGPEERSHGCTITTKASGPRWNSPLLPASGGVAPGEANFQSPRETEHSGVAKLLQRDVWSRKHFYWGGCVLRKGEGTRPRDRLLTDTWR